MDWRKLINLCLVKEEPMHGIGLLTERATSICVVSPVDETKTPESRLGISIGKEIFCGLSERFLIFEAREEGLAGYILGSTN
jgi:hypothetical protein